MTIDEAIRQFIYIRQNPTGDIESELLPEAKELFDVAIDAMRKYQLMQGDYNARLNADMVAMLTEIQTEIDEIELDLPFGFEPATKTEAFYQGVSASEKVIQKKIEKLKEH